MAHNRAHDVGDHLPGAARVFSALDAAAAGLVVVAGHVVWATDSGILYIATGPGAVAEAVRAEAATRLAHLAERNHGSLAAIGADDHHAQGHAHASHSAIGADDHHAQAHALASHSSKAHSELTAIGADDHHAQGHTLASHSTKAHAELTSIGVDDHHAKAHGAGDHTDRLRTVSPGAYTVDGGTATTIGAAPDIIAATTLADAATQGVYASRGVRIPNDCVAGSALSIIIAVATKVTDAGPNKLRWSVDAKVLADGVTPATAGTTTAFNGTSRAWTINQKVTEPTTSLVITVNPGDLVMVNVRRLGADAADDHNHDVNIIDFVLQYTSDE